MDEIPETAPETDGPGARRGPAVLVAGFMGPWLAIGAGILWAAMRASEEGSALAWTQSLNPGGWMAWVLPTALFFWIVAGILAVFSILAIRHPETPRRGILRIETTRGDRLFISLLVAGFVNLAWLGLGIGPQWGALVLSLVLAAGIFRTV